MTKMKFVYYFFLLSKSKIYWHMHCCCSIVLSSSISKENCSSAKTSLFTKYPTLACITFLTLQHSRASLSATNCRLAAFTPLNNVGWFLHSTQTAGGVPLKRLNNQAHADCGGKADQQPLGIQASARSALRLAFRHASNQSI